MAGKSFTRTAEVPEMWSRAPGVFKTPLKGLRRLNHFHDNIKTLFALFHSHSLMRIQWSVSEATRHLGCHNRWKAAADRRIQLFSVKSDIKEIYKNVRKCHSSY